MVYGSGIRGTSRRVAGPRNPARNQIDGTVGEFYWEDGTNVNFWCDPQEGDGEGGDRMFRRFRALVYRALVD